MRRWVRAAYLFRPENEGRRLVGRRAYHLLRELAQWEAWDETGPAQRLTAAG